MSVNCSMYSFNVRQSGMEIGGMGTSIQKNANGNKCLASMGMTMRMGLKLMRMGKIGKAESHPRIPLLCSQDLKNVQHA